MSTQNQEIEPRHFEFPNGILLKQWDTFCWMCHNVCDEDIRCSECTAVVHSQCLTYMVTNEDQLFWKCSECEEVASCLIEERNKEYIRKSLKCAIESIMRRNNNATKKQFELPTVYYECELLVNRITLMEIWEKVKRNEYSCTKSFEVDFKWLLHNCIILSKQYPVRKAISGAKELLNRCRDEIIYMKNCTDCYTRGPHQFVFTCSKPHLLLWVKFRNYPYWPAKLMRIGKGSTPIEVTFFGEFESAAVPPGNCLLYSRSNPNKTQEKTETWNKAISDVNKHIKRLEEQFGSFHYAPKNTPFMTANLKQYLTDMLPGFRELSETDQDQMAYDEIVNEQPDLNIIDLTNAAMVEDQLENEPSEYFPSNCDITTDIRDQGITEDLSTDLEPNNIINILEQDNQKLKSLIEQQIQTIEDLKRELESKNKTIEMDRQMYKRKIEMIRKEYDAVCDGAKRPKNDENIEPNYTE